MELVLASASPRRRQLMALVHPTFRVQVADVDEAGITAATPAELAGRLAREKAAAVAALALQSAVIGCDTVVDLDGRALGKPCDEADAIAMLTELAGRVHAVHTGVCVLLPGGGSEAFVETTLVHFAPIPAAEIAAYAATSEPYDKAGGYGVQGWAARYIPRIEGCYYNVMGLPVASLYRVLCGRNLLSKEKSL